MIVIFQIFLVLYYIYVCLDGQKCDNKKSVCESG